MSIDDIVEFKLKIRKKRPVFYAIPEFLWGKNASYDSDGDCKGVDDDMWTELDVSNRNSKVRFSVVGDDGIFTGGLRTGNKEDGVYRISSNDEETAIKVTYYLWKHCDAEFLDRSQELLVVRWAQDCGWH